MVKYICSICGFVYDKQRSIPEAGIAPGTTWEELPDWVCLSAVQQKLNLKQGEQAASRKRNRCLYSESAEDMKEMSALELSALCANLARGCEKQYKPEESTLFRELAEHFKSASAPAKEPSFDKLMALIEKDLAEGFPNANAAASDAKDRGALRALVWSEKVTRILKSLLTRYQKEGDAMLENTGVYVCTICSFIYIGDILPEVCPVQGA